jgi:hypothetical protein
MPCHPGPLLAGWEKSHDEQGRPYYKVPSRISFSPSLLVHHISSFTLYPYLLISLSPYLLISLSLYIRISLSPYLKDNGTGETTYEDPREKAAAEAAREAELGPLPRAWEMIYDQHGQLYFQKALPKVPA